MNSKNIALVFAGGIGSRMGADVPKQFIELSGKPVLIWTLDRFERNRKIDAIYLVITDGWQKETENLTAKFNIKKIKTIVTGGETALKSIHNGLVRMSTDGVNANDFVLIHDGVRPIVSNELINEGIETARQFGNSVCSRPAIETVATVDGRTIKDITDRSNTRTLQAPQIFRFGEIFDIYQKAATDGLLDKYVDSAQVALANGIKLHWIEGIKENIKLTTFYDLKYFQFLLDHNYKEVVSV